MTQFVCQTCGSSWSSIASLQAHRGRHSYCKELQIQKERETLEALDSSRRYLPQNNEPLSTSTTSSEEEYVNADSDFFETPVQYESELLEVFDQELTAEISHVNHNKELLLAFTRCANDVGLSISDMDKLLKVITHPTYNPSQIAFTTGRQAHELLKKFKAQQVDSQVCLSLR